LISNEDIVARLTLESMWDFFDPTPEEQNVILVTARTLTEAEKLIESCEQCNPDGAEIPFDIALPAQIRA